MIAIARVTFGAIGTGSGRGLFMGMFLVLLSCPPIMAATGADGGQFDGAVWNFSLRPKSPGSPNLRGRFRVSDHVLYQKASPEDADFTVQIGKNHPRGKRARVELTNFRAFGPGRELHSGMSGMAMISMDRGGEWSGRFIDSSGKHWDFKCTRVQE